MKSRSTLGRSNRGVYFTLLFLSLILPACATTEENIDVEPSGFLKDYTQFKKGGGERAALYYINPEADFSVYSKIILEPVTVWVTEDSDLKDVPKEDLESLTYYMYTAIMNQLVGDYNFVSAPGADVMRIRLAFTEASGGTAPLDILTTYIPPARLITEGVHLASGTYAFVGSATVEMEILDSVSGERLLGFVDQRQGTKGVTPSTKTWGDVEDACDFWAARMKERLKQARENKLLLE